HKAFLNERSTNPLTHQSRLRSTCHSLKRNLPHLYTFERYPDLGIHNTTNLLEGRFADLKAKLRCHQGMKKENKVRFIKDYFSKKMPARASILSLTPKKSYSSDICREQFERIRPLLGVSSRSKSAVMIASLSNPTAT
ncbi:MAG: hypothetical protein Q4A06_10000, partial [Cardiobacteriaceae bacterium]|nr:hypothetical protein [Cardiobacteriaceae bacterium]